MREYEHELKRSMNSIAVQPREKPSSESIWIVECHDPQRRRNDAKLRKTCDLRSLHCKLRKIKPIVWVTA